MTRDLPVPARALAIGSHPDDVEFGCGATLAKWAAAGCEVSHLVCTDGSKGSWDPGEDPSTLVVLRQAEQEAAARVLGATGARVFLRWIDGELEAGLRQRWEVAYWIRKLQPDVVLGHDPWKRYRLHPDHRAAGFLTIDGVVAARDPHFFPEQELAFHRAGSILLFEADEADHVEDVTGYGEVKVAALLEHRSQWRSTHGIDDPEDAGQLERFRRTILDELADAGARAGVAAGEAFRAITDI